MQQLNRNYYFPLETLLHFFSHLEEEHLHTAKLTCKYFHLIINQEFCSSQLKKRHITQFIINQESLALSNYYRRYLKFFIPHLPREYIITRNIFSNKKLIEGTLDISAGSMTKKLHRFLESLHNNENDILDLSPLSPDEKIEIFLREGAKLADPKSNTDRNNHFTEELLHFCSKETLFLILKSQEPSIRDPYLKKFIYFSEPEKKTFFLDAYIEILRENEKPENEILKTVIYFAAFSHVPDELIFPFIEQLEHIKFDFLEKMIISAVCSDEILNALLEKFIVTKSKKSNNLIESFFTNVISEYYKFSTFLRLINVLKARNSIQVSCLKSAVDCDFKENEILDLIEIEDFRKLKSNPQLNWLKYALEAQYSEDTVNRVLTKLQTV